MTETLEPEQEPPHDILAAEAFALGASDPQLHHEPAHDVLAAEEFPVPAPEPHAVPPGWHPVPNPAAAVPSPASSRRVPGRALVGGLMGAALFVTARRRGRRRRGRQP